MTGELAGKVAIVTGSTRGLGRAIAARFAAEGALVGATDFDLLVGRRPSAFARAISARCAPVVR